MYDPTPRPTATAKTACERLGHTPRKDAAAMHSAGNPLATLLLTAPLLVVPTIAALGVPGAGSPAGEEPAFTLGAVDPLGDDPFGAGDLGEPGDDGFEDAADPFGTPADAAPTRWAGGDDLFGDAPLGDAPDGRFADSGDGAAAFADEPAAPTVNKQNALASAFDDADFGEVVTADVPEPTARTAELADGSAARALTETAARGPAPGAGDISALSRQLKALGATRLGIEPAGDHYYFGCTLVETAGGATIARRFEAEEPTAAAAVADVLAQVRRHRAAPAPGGVALATP